MTTEARIGFGTLFQISEGGSPTEYTTVGEVTSISLPALQRDAVDATHMESPGGWREFVPGLKNAGEVKVELNFVPASNSDQIIRNQLASDDLTLCRIVFPVPASPTEAVTFSGILTNYEVTAPVGDKMAATVTVKVSGEVTWGIP